VLIVVALASIKSGYMNGVQSRIQLQLAVAAGYSMSEIRDVFEAPTREAIYNNDIYFK
jgi:L-asparaginase/Glu-tRNA(Gln) amidotransferase subunit D